MPMTMSIEDAVTAPHEQPGDPTYDTARDQPEENLHAIPPLGLSKGCAAGSPALR